MYYLTIMENSTKKPLPESLEKCHELINHLEDRIAFFERQLFGPKADRVSDLTGQPDMLEKSKPQEAAPPAEGETAEAAKPAEKRKARPHGKRDLGLAHHLPILEQITLEVAKEDMWCLDCAEAKCHIGDKVSWRLTVRPAQYGRVRVVQKQCACPVCQGNVCAAEPAMELIPGGLAAPELIADTIVKKYCYHIPLQRQETMAAAHGVHLPKTTLWSILKLTTEGLGVLTDLMAQRLRASSHLAIDETPIPVLAKGKTRTGQMWVMYGGQDAPYVVFNFRNSRSGAVAKELLTGFAGTLKSDAYKVYESLTRAGSLKWASCWAHVRRKFVDAWQRLRDPVAQHAIKEIGQLYDIEREVKDCTYGERVRIREERARPVVDQLLKYLGDEQVSITPGSVLGQAVAYTLNLAQSLRTYLSDGEVAIDNNEVERQIRAVAMGRKNYMFVGNEVGGRAAALFYTLIASAKRHDLNVYEYLEDIIRNLPGWPRRNLAQLLPDQWKPTAKPLSVSAEAAAGVLAVATTMEVTTAVAATR